MSATNLVRLHEEQDQSPWLDNIKRSWITGGELAAWVKRGIRGVTSNPTILQKAIESSDAYDEQFARLIAQGSSIEDAYWALVIEDIRGALQVLRPVYDSSNGVDGFVSIEVHPGLADDTEGTIAAARHFFNTIDEPNLYVKIPATPAGVPAIRQMVAEGRNVNITLLFSLERYGEVIEAYLSGLESFEGDLSTVVSVASFFVSRVDSETDKRLDEIGTDEARALRGKAAVANARLAYDLFQQKFSGPRWEALAKRGARVQRPLWASTSTKNPDYPDTLYIDTLIGPETVNTIPEATIEAFDDHGTVARTVDSATQEAHSVLGALSEVGVDLADVTHTLEVQGVAAFSKSLDELFASLQTKADALKA